MIEVLSQPWHWAVSGVGIVGVMLLLLLAGGEFGVSGNLRTLCSIGGAGRRHAFFDFNWRSQLWNLVFIAGAIGGGFIAHQYLSSPKPLELSASTVEYLQSVGIQSPNSGEADSSFVPDEMFSLSALQSPFNVLFLIVGGFLVGFGTRWAGGCTSGHAISGLANLQLPSLIAVIGFFVGGLTMTWLILPHLLRWMHLIP